MCENEIFIRVRLQKHLCEEIRKELVRSTLNSKTSFSLSLLLTIELFKTVDGEWLNCAEAAENGFSYGLNRPIALW